VSLVACVSSVAPWRPHAIGGGADPEECVVAGFHMTHTLDSAQTDAVRDDALVIEPDEFMGVGL
jgi:hypothetical protein